MKKVDRQKWYKLLDKLDLTENESIEDVIDAVLRYISASELYAEGLENKIVTLENEEHSPDENAARLVHSQHSESYLVDLSLCPHPDCSRIWRAS